MSYHVGYRDVHNPFEGRVWYPAPLTAKEGPIPTARLFTSQQGAKDAPVISHPQKLPLLLLSHGSGGTFDRLDWMADFFARRGWIVAAFNHPGNTRENNSVEGLVRVWRRAEQLSAFLTVLLDRDPLRESIDRERIVAAGHSAGGATVLLLAGTRLSYERFQNPIPFCAPRPREFDDEHCAELRQYNFRQHSKNEIERSYRDTRVRAVVALDPAFGNSFRPEEEQKLLAPTLFVFAKHRKDPSGAIFTKTFQHLFPRHLSVTVPGAIHISFVSSCSVFGLRIAAPICLGDEKRDEIHERTNHEVEQFLHGWK
ncbi:MAG: alpha/beta fold hydrolase [Deltaproteobacteria bacterium]|nr:alpha/beta fold hydrolase [Deltaproteobacteria bacterium]